jgi:hypothetical protein
MARVGFVGETFTVEVKGWLVTFVVKRVSRETEPIVATAADQARLVDGASPMKIEQALRAVTNDIGNYHGPARRMVVVVNAGVGIEGAEDSVDSLQNGFNHRFKPNEVSMQIIVPNAGRPLDLKQLLEGDKFTDAIIFDSQRGIPELAGQLSGYTGSAHISNLLVQDADSSGTVINFALSVLFAVEVRLAELDTAAGRQRFLDRMQLVMLNLFGGKVPPEIVADIYRLSGTREEIGRRLNEIAAKAPILRGVQLMDMRSQILSVTETIWAA